MPFRFTPPTNIAPVPNQPKHTQVGTHPEDGEPIYSNSGRFGPYVVHRTLYAPLPKDRTPQDVSLEEAVESLTAKAARMRARGKDPYAVSWFDWGQLCCWLDCVVGRQAGRRAGV